jgi:hypothetical protein
MKRAEIVQALLNLFEKPGYLEIGLFKATTFQQLKAARKVGVDPQFKFERKEVLAADPTAELHKMESDAYFGTVVGPDERFHVIFIDGLHTFEQTLRDFCNALEHLKPGGAILIDDVVPSGYAASLRNQTAQKRLNRALPEAQQSHDWMGDVYRLMFFIETFFQSWSYATVAETGGQMVVWREPRAKVPQRRVERVARLGFEATVLKSASYNTMPLAEILERIEARRAVG